MKKIFPVLLGALVIFYWYVFMRFVPPPPLAVSRETTYFTDLTEKNGRYNLASSLNALYHLPPEENGAIEFLRIYGTDIVSTDSADIAEFCRLVGIEPALLATPTLIMPLPDFASDTFVMNSAGERHDVFRRPWQAEEFPQIAALIEANADTFALLASLSSKSGFYWPRLERYTTLQMPMSRDFMPNKPMSLLLARGMLYLHAADFKRAWEDFVCVGKAARPLLQSDILIYGLFGVVGIKNAADAMSHLLLQKNLEEEFLLQMLADLDEIIMEKGLERAVEQEVRFFQLSVYLESNDSLMDKTSLGGGSSDNDYDRYIDKNVFCRKVNLLADKVMQVCNLEKVSERIAALNKLQTDQKQIRPDASVTKMMTKLLWIKYLTPSKQKCSAISEIISEILLDISSPGYTGLLIELLSVSEKLRLLKVAVLIRLHRIRTGNYPSSLEELDLVDKQMLIDSFSGKNFKFRSEGNNILVYSVGADQQDNLGAPGGQVESEEEPTVSDITIQIIKF
ncbi:MAG: hypothetical protein CVV42_02495 [Candidatus Riflebacteria bacterium HGW-Riflebacteria-2]|jgi:hypothetical protein|nr:MAG: hypothetical protein CVV42_02495 [Candidatus Riflebacteria bacterium HGW-Riflebacteria-2]